MLKKLFTCFRKKDDESFALLPNQQIHAEVNNNNGGNHTNNQKQKIQILSRDRILHPRDQSVDSQTKQRPPSSIVTKQEHQGNLSYLIQDQKNVHIQKRPSLFLAVVKGERSHVQQLLKAHEDITVTFEEGETLLHVAAFYGHDLILQDLLNIPGSQSLINAQDHDGKTPLHKALWGEPKLSCVKLLLKYGADPNTKNKFGYNSLHWAAKHEHLESMILLIESGAQHYRNDNGDFPLDLATRWERDKIVLFFLGIRDRIQREKKTSESDEHYLLQAKQENQIEEQIFYLQKIGQNYLRLNSFVVSAKILNYAIALLKMHLNNPLFETHLFNRLNKIEQLFLQSKGLEIHLDWEVSHQKILYFREQLAQVRRNCEKALLDQKKSIQEIVGGLTEGFKTILKEMIAEAQQLLGPPPVKWACIGMGSMARGEMCPYSDLEFAFLLEEESDEALQYFRILSHLLELQIINLGETKFSIFGNTEKSLIPSGFSFDTGGNTPLGVPGLYELIGTPKQLAKFQTSLWMDRNIILVNASSTVCLVAGDPKLYSAYNSEKEKAWLYQETYKTISLNLLAGHLMEFSPNLSKEKEDLKAFGIKKELYRPFQGILGCLAVFYHLKKLNSFERIEELVDLGIFSSEGATSLKHALSQVLKLRLEAHLFYKDEKEFLLPAFLDLKQKNFELD
jgi:ankyrin repeat protein/predicted nucleotidyltransferase